MPKYVYFCKECEENFEIKHSLRETRTNCENCGGKDSLERRPSEIFLAKKQSKFAETSEAGAIVKSAIEEATQDLKQDKDVLKNRMYKK